MADYFYEIENPGIIYEGTNGKLIAVSTEFIEK